MEKKLQVFISSTYVDMIAERQKTVEAILDAGHIPAGMELFKSGKSQMETIKRWIDESDVYCLLMGGRYGSVEDESGKSYTQLEYEYAESKRKPIIVILLSTKMLYQKAAENPNINIFEEGDKRFEYEMFKNTISKKIYKLANNIQDIATFIHSELNGIVKTQSMELSGWIKESKGIGKISGETETKLTYGGFSSEIACDSEESG